MRKVNHKGFTLIELVVTIAIIAIFTGVITMLISNGSASYRSTSGNARVQMETQETLNQIQDLVIDTNRTMYYGAGENLNDLPLITNDIDGGGLDDNTVKTFVVCSASDASSGQKDKEDYVWDVLTWKSADKKIYYNRYEKKDQIKYEEPIVTPTPEGTGSSTANKTLTAEDSPSAVSGVQNNVATPAPNPTVTMENADHLIEQSVFAEDITGFWADIREVETKRVVRFQIQADKRGKNIKTLHTVNLRNKVKIEKPGNISALPSVDASIKITNIPKELADDCGGYLFEKVTFGEIMAGSVQWSVAGDNGQNIPGWEFPDSAHGKLIIKTPESYSGEYITVTVKATSINGKEITDSCKVKIIRKGKPSLTADSIIVGVGNDYDLNDYVKITAKYPNGTIKEFNKSNSTFQWKVDSEPKIEENGKIKIPSDYTGNEHTVYVTSCTHNDGTSIKDTVNVPLKIARLELKKPSGTYHVGDKKELLYTYTVGGAEDINVKPEVEVQNKNSSASKPNMDYSSQDEVFALEDIGKWIAYASVTIENGKKVTASSEFEIVSDKIEFVRKNPLSDECTTTIDKNVVLETSLKINDVEQTLAKISWECKDEQGNSGNQVFQGDGLTTTFIPPAPGKYTVTATYIHKDKTEHKVIFKITVSKLYMEIIPKDNKKSFWKGKSEILKAYIRNTSNEQGTDVTEQYNIVWSIDDNSTELPYTLTPMENERETTFNVINDITVFKKVKVKAIAYNKNDTEKKQPVCEAEIELTVNPKRVFEKTYELSNEKPQPLEHDILEEHKTKYPIKLISSTPEQITDLITLSKPVEQNWSVKVINWDKWNSGDKVELWVEYDTFIYKYTLTAAIYNVYDYNETTGKFELLELYIPGDTDIIRDNSKLSGDGYTYTYKTNYELRLSISRYTGWFGIGGWFRSSARKWFMKLDDKYYQYDVIDQCWYDWTGINIYSSATYIKFHWTGKGYIGISYPPSSYWQKWN